MATVRLGQSTFDLARYVVSGPAGDTRLRPRSADVLRYLVAHAGRVVSKHELLAAVWGDVAVTDDSLVQCLIEIRRALGETPDVIRTIRGRGYLLEAEVEHLSRPSGPSASSEGAPVPAVRPPRQRLAYAAIGVTALLAVSAAAMFVRPAAPASTGGRSLRDTMNPEARRTLDEGLALTRGSRAQTDMHHARQLFERALALDDSFAAAHAALGNALVLLSGFGVEPARTVLPRALAEARRAVALDPTLASGWQALAHAQTQGDWDWAGAEESYRRAIALDPAAQSNMVFAHLLVGLGRTEEAVTESDRLLAFDSGSSMRHGSNCVVKYLARRYADALAACDRGLAIKPDESLAHFWRALTLTALGRHDEAMQAALSARRDMGFEPTWLVGFVHAQAGRLDAAREVLRAVDARAQTSYVPPVEIAYLHAAVGDRAGALDWLERAHQAQGPWMELLAVHPVVDSLRAEPRFRALLAQLRLPELP